jgi:hypothetical protein
MRDLALQASGIVAMIVAVAHGVLGETHVFARARIEPERLRLLIRLVWLCGAVAWFCGGVLLFMTPSIAGEEARRWIILLLAVVYMSGVIGNAWATRGRHPGWMLLALAVVLSLLGL